MPTGYTDGVSDGTITTFEEYALTCARAFGACVTLRDEPLNGDIPEFTVDEYYKRWVDETKTELERFSNLTHDQLVEEYNNDIANRQARAAQAASAIEDRKLQQRRYEMMLARAKLFKPPTGSHIEFGKFIVEQLKQSIAYCGTRSYDNMTIPSFEVWQVEKLDQLKSNAEYAVQSYEDEVKRVASRNEWVRNLRKAIKEVEDLWESRFISDKAIKEAISDGNE